MRIRSLFKRCVLVAPLFTCLTPTKLLAQDVDVNGGWDDPAAYGTPYTAYRAGIGHAEVNRRPLDYSIRDPLPQEAAREPADWSGFYFGATLGGVLGDTNLDGSVNASTDTNGFAIGGHVGKNWNLGPTFIGVEVDAVVPNASDRTSSPGQGVSSSLDWLTSARARAGYGFGDFLVYGTAGVALAGTEVDVTLPGVSASTTSVHTGMVIGAGAEMQLMENVNARLEALHYNFSDESFSLPGGGGDIEQSVTTVRAGISLQLN